LSGFLLGIAIAFGFIGGAALAPFVNSAQRVARGRKAETVSSLASRTRAIADGLNVPLVDKVRPPEKPVEVVVRVTEGGCPLMREVGDIFRVSASGQLSSPLCSPSAAAVQRLIRGHGVESGTTERCVCPVGPHKLTFALDAA
jgi:hypothetical protein